MNLALIVLISAAVIIGYTKYQNLLGRYNEAQASAADLYNEVLLANQFKTKAETELGFLQQSIIQLMQRPVMATLSDQQVNSVTGALVAYIDSVKNPEKMN